jgi:hypothetical protein
MKKSIAHRSFQAVRHLLWREIVAFARVAHAARGRPPNVDYFAPAVSGNISTGLPLIYESIVLPGRAGPAIPRRSYATTSQKDGSEQYSERIAHLHDFHLPRIARQGF